MALPKALLARFDRDIPSLQLAISVSGESLSTSLPPGISPSRLLQSSILLTMADTQFAQDPSRPIQIGPSFTVTLYMLFLGHAANPSGHQDHRDDEESDNTPATPDKASRRPPLLDEGYGVGEGDRKPLWQEVMHKARVRLCRTPVNYAFDPIQGFVPPSKELGQFNEIMSDNGYDQIRREYAYHIEIIENLDDDRVHDDTNGAYGSYDTIRRAGIRESIPIHQVSKVFYTDTGRILNIGNSFEVENNPVLLLKRDVHATRPRGMGNMAVPLWETNDGDARTSSRRRAYMPDSSRNDSDGSDSELEVDRQLREDSGTVATSLTADRSPEPASAAEEAGRELRFPRHLDPEWIALEAFEENDTSSIGSDLGNNEHSDDEKLAAPPGTRIYEDRSSLDSRLIAQIKSLSFGPAAGRAHEPHSPARYRHVSTELWTSNQPNQLNVREMSGLNSPPSPVQDENFDDRQASFVARSPFGAITTSLSLMEMLIRLTSLQQFQQANHLSIPDYMLNFFLEDTSTTGLRGEQSWKVRHEARRRVGFDPYTDTPVKQRAPAEDF